MTWECFSRFAQIKAPTLVIHGKSDALFPPAMANCSQNTFREQNSFSSITPVTCFLTDQVEASEKAIFDFLSSVSADKAGHEKRKA